MSNTEVIHESTALGTQPITLALRLVEIRLCIAGSGEQRLQMLDRFLFPLHQLREPFTNLLVCIARFHS
jgi:hypothetical protein